MNLQEIKEAVDMGLTVCWKQYNYPVLKNKSGVYYIHCENGSDQLLTRSDGTLNEDEADYFIDRPRYYIFYTGQASTPVSIGIMDRTTGNDIVRIPLWTDTNTGKQVREAYEKHKKVLQTKIDNLNKRS